MRQIKITMSEDEANKAVIQLMQRQSKIIAMRPFTTDKNIGIAIEYEEK